MGAGARGDHLDGSVHQILQAFHRNPQPHAVDGIRAVEGEIASGRFAQLVFIGDDIADIGVLSFSVQ